ncbi:histidine kinase [Hymenobacter sp. H14-R3]|uniref:ATP-binding protein n=1 Tax=Hymenobacter sp. H14-R3 TaxID=3046308 RepID=UPI0024B89BE2|nr:ATP-binding protein [Hymenobacter sp. H14-R3]MDJ0366164.1 histidine kinase [Hymenobacter sp. H14-R3]
MLYTGRGFFLLLLCLVLGREAAQAQGPTPPLAQVAAVRDSIGRLLVAEPRRDTTRVGRLNALSFILRTNEAPQSQYLARQALALAQQLHFSKGLLDAHFNLGYYFRACNQYDSAIYYSRKALDMSMRIQSRYTQTRAYYNLTRIYTEQGNYAAALGPSLDGLALAHTIHNARAELFQLVQVGRIELALGDYAAAYTHVIEASRLIAAAHDPLGTGYVYFGLGDISREQGQWLAARRYYVRAETNWRLVYNAHGLLPIELSKAEMTDRLGDHLAARGAAYGLLRRAQATGGTPEQVTRATLLLAQTWLATARPDSARYYAARSLAASLPAHLRPAIRDAAQVLAQASDQMGKGHDAYRYQALASTYADSINGEATRRRAAALQTQAARSQQQDQIILLRQQARLQTQQQELQHLRYRQGAAALVGLALVVLAAGGYGLWRYRRRETLRQEALRTRIAADLHDEVGSMLTQISMQSTLLREGRYAPAQQQAYLDQMADASRRAARQMSDAVWSIDARYDSAASLLDRLRDHAHEVLPPAGLELDFAAEPAVATAPLPLATRQALYYIYKEALHNVVKHAQARQVRVRLRLLGQQLELLVHDDGRGLPTAAGRPGGQGLRNMRMRAQAVGGVITFAAAAPGTSVVVHLPLG